jgi:hypothetical protein
LRLGFLLLPLAVACFVSSPTAQAGSATWKRNARSGDWNTKTNWTPAHDASPKDFRAACWLLERSYPGEYARTETRIIEQKAEEQKMGGCTILYNVGNHTLAELLDFPTMDDPPEVAAEKQRRLLEMTPAKNAPVSA